MSWDWDDERTVVWGQVQGRLVIQRGDDWAQQLREVQTVADVNSVEQARIGHPAAPWLADHADQYVEDATLDLDDDHGHAHVSDDEYVQALRESYSTGSRLGVPWAHRLPSDWIPDDIIADAQTDPHAHDLGSTVTWPDDAVDRLGAAGFRTVEAPDVLAAPLDFPDMPDV